MEPRKLERSRDLLTRYKGIIVNSEYTKVHTHSDAMRSHRWPLSLMQDSALYSRYLAGARSSEKLGRRRYSAGSMQVRIFSRRYSSLRKPYERR
jgi:hypothetical protein